MSNNPKKTYVLDTNVLVHDAQSLYNFEEHDIVIPQGCIGELDSFKGEQSERGAGARDAARELDKFRLKARELGSSLKKGVIVAEGHGIISVYSDRINKSDLNIPLTGKNEVDYTCIEITNKLRKAGIDAVLVTKDINLRIMADSCDIPCEDYRHDKKGHSLESLFSMGGVKEVYVSMEEINELYKEKGRVIQLQEDLSQEAFINQGLILNSNDGTKTSALVRYLPDNKVKRIIYDKKGTVASIRARNLEQTFALDALLDPAVRVCALLGKAGTGKTLLALAAGIQMIQNSRYKKIIAVRPTIVMGKDLGFLPGNLEEKESPYMDPIKDNLSIILDDGKDPDRWNEESYMQYIKEGQLEFRTPIYIRGRSLPRVYIVVDEVQNLTFHEVNTIVTRMGEETKLVLVGDPWQIDNPYLDEESNGLTSVVRKLMGKREYIVTDFLKKGERDPSITDDLADLLK